MHVALLVKEGGYTIAAESLTCQERDFCEGKNHMGGVKNTTITGPYKCGVQQRPMCGYRTVGGFGWCSQVSELVFPVFLYRRRSIEQIFWVHTASYLSP